MSSVRQLEVEKTRALLTSAEREALTDEHGKNRKYQAKTHARRRIEDELPTDVMVLRENHPELFEKLCEVACDER